MKIRIKGNSIRFRLTQSEVKQLSETGLVLETTEFGDLKFEYGVRLASDIIDLRATYSNHRITMLVPEENGRTWFNNDRVGFENFDSLPNNEKLHLLLEKDFTCLENRSEDESDNYPNPKLQH